MATRQLRNYMPGDLFVVRGTIWTYGLDVDDNEDHSIVQLAQGDVLLYIGMKRMRSTRLFLSSEQQRVVYTRHGDTTFFTYLELVNDGSSNKCG